MLRFLHAEGYVSSVRFSDRLTQYGDCELGKLMREKDNDFGIRNERYQFGNSKLIFAWRSR